MNTQSKNDDSIKPGKWKRRLKRVTIVAVICTFLGAFYVRNDVRTLASLQRVPGTNAFVMDYYSDYSLDEIETNGMDIHNVEDTCIKAFFPDVILPIARFVKRSFIPEEIETTEDSGHHCSSVFLRSSDGTCYFARNSDYHNDAFLILRVHDHQGLASIAIIDLAYLNLNRADLENTDLIERIPLLFAPYYAFDGINRHGVAVGIMSVDDRPVATGHDASKPDVINTTLMRIILDNAKSTEEAVSIAKKYNVHFVAMPQHVLIGDASGQSGILEHIDGNVRFIAPQSKWQVCTNHQMYQTSEAQSDERCERYREGSAIADRLESSFGQTEVNAVIRSMYVDGWTMWTSVFNLTNGDVAVTYKGKTELVFHDHIAVDGE